jgi:hypothetical protein
LLWSEMRIVYLIWIVFHWMNSAIGGATAGIRFSSSIAIFDNNQFLLPCVLGTFDSVQSFTISSFFQFKFISMKRWCEFKAPGQHLL